MPSTFYQGREWIKTLPPQSLNSTAFLPVFHFLKKQSATREYLSDSFGTGNAFLLVLFKTFHGTVPTVPEEHIRYLTLVNPECSMCCSQDIWVDTMHHMTQLSWLLAWWVHMTLMRLGMPCFPLSQVTDIPAQGEKVRHTSSGPESLLPILCAWLRNIQISNT